MRASRILPWKVFLCYQQTIFFLHELRKLSHQARARFHLCVFCCHLSCLRGWTLHHKARREEVKSLWRRNMLEVFTISNFGLHHPRLPQWWWIFRQVGGFECFFAFLLCARSYLFWLRVFQHFFVRALTQLFVCVLFGKSKWWAGKRDMWCRGASFSHYLRIYETNEWAGGLRELCGGEERYSGDDECIWGGGWALHTYERKFITYESVALWRRDKSTEQVWDVVFIIFKWWK